MSNVVLTRIDNRLIHGQVAKQWAKETGANLLLVVNDEAAQDTLRQQLMNMAAPAGVNTRYVPVDEAMDVIANEGDKTIFIIVENPSDALKLVEAGAPIEKINVGNMHMCEGKHQIAVTVAIDDADKEVFRKLADKNVALEIQRNPGVAKEDASELTK